MDITYRMEKPVSVVWISVPNLRLNLCVFAHVNFPNNNQCFELNQVRLSIIELYLRVKRTKNKKHSKPIEKGLSGNRWFQIGADLTHMSQICP